MKKPYPYVSNVEMFEMEKSMESVLDIRLNVPKSDMRFFRELAVKMGWEVETREGFLRKCAASRPKDVKLSDKDVLPEGLAPSGQCPLALR